ncbi:MAG TPA: hypothetical protein VIN08_12865, partial [Ohtaekwangia sp.]
MQNILRPFYYLVVLVWACSPAVAQKALRSEIAEIARSLNAKVGVAVMHLEKKDTVSYQGAQHLVMQSVFKFP